METYLRFLEAWPQFGPALTVLVVLALFFIVYDLGGALINRKR